MPEDARVPRPVKAAALWLLFLGPFFFLIYGLCNFYASRRLAVPSFYFPWEQKIPFVPAMIVPYVSIDAFFAGAVFLCRDRRELDIHVFRIIAAILISAVGFLVFPLKFAFQRPEVGGVYGFFFDLLGSFDKPFNQAPSLHLSMLLILWVCYARHVVVRWRWLLDGWFALIGVSVLFVFQHHAIDICTGLAVGVICLYALPDAQRLWRGCALTDDPQRRRIGLRYLAGSLLCLILAATLRSWTWLLIWPAVSLLLVALGYFALGPAVFQKAQGRQSWPARLLLLPYLLGAWISYRLFTRSAPAMHQIIPDVYLGRRPRADDLDHCHAVAVLDMTGEFSAPMAATQRVYVNIPVLDLTVPEPAALKAALAFIGAHVQAGPVYVHCALGLSRSATVIAAWLVRSKRITGAADALAHVAALRRGVKWSPAHVLAITQACGDALTTADKRKCD